MKIKQEYNKLYEFQLREEIKECGIDDAEGVIKLLYSDSEYQVINTWAKEPEQSFVNRVNELWVIPLFLLAAPIRYVMFGDYKVNPESKLGKVLTYLLGVLR